MDRDVEIFGIRLLGVSGETLRKAVLTLLLFVGWEMVLAGKKGKLAGARTPSE